MSIKLTNDNIASCVRAADEFCNKYKIDSKNAISTRLALEETLLAFQKQFGMEYEFTYRCVKILGSCRIVISVAGPRFNPLNYQEDSIMQSNLLSSMLRKLIFEPSYTYQVGTNQVVFSLKKRDLSSIPGGSNMIALIIGLVIGLIYMQCPIAFRDYVSQTIFDPIYSTIIEMLIAITGPFIFVSLMTCIASLGDVNTFKNLGLNIVRRISRMAILTTIIAIFVSLSFFPLKHAEYVGTMTNGNFLKRLLAIVPTNMFLPFLRNNSIHIVFIAVFMGICALIIGDKISNFKIILSELNTLMSQAMDIIAKLNFPLIVLSIISLMNNINTELVLKLIKVVAACAITNIIIIAMYFGYILIRHNKSPMNFLKLMMPAISIGFFTASSTSAMFKNYELIDSKSEVNEDLHDLWNPLTFALASSTVVFLTVGTIFIANYTHTYVNMVWFIVAFLMIFQLNFAAPKVQGGIIATFTLLFSQLSINADYLGLLSAANVLVMNMNVGCNMIVRELDLYDLVLSQKEKTK